MKKLLFAVLMLCVVLCGCMDQPVKEGDTIIVKDGDVIGSGETSVNLEIIDGEGKAINVVIKTDKTILGEALEESKIAYGSHTEYGLFITKVNGIVADYNINQTYWAVLVNGESSLVGVSSITIVPTDKYTLKVAK